MSHPKRIKKLSSRLNDDALSKLIEPLPERTEQSLSGGRKSGSAYGEIGTWGLYVHND